MQNLEKDLSQFKNLKFAVIGDIMLDRTETGFTSGRKNPEEKKNQKIPIIQTQKEELYIGGAGNVARNLISIGSQCDFYGIVGEDMYGRELTRMCNIEKIGTRNLIMTPRYPTIVKARHFIDGKYKKRHDIGEKDEKGKSLLEKIEGDLADVLTIGFRNNASQYDGVILSDYNKHIFSEKFSQEVIKIARKNNLPIFSDIKPENLNFFKGCTLICPNTTEAQKMTGIKYSLEKLDEMGQMLQKRVGSQYVVITCSEDGAYVYDNGNSKLIETQARKIGEVTGAGDSFIALLMASYASRIDIYNSVEVANCGAGIAVEKKGTSIVTCEEILKRLKSKI